MPNRTDICPKRLQHGCAPQLNHAADSATRVRRSASGPTKTMRQTRLKLLNDSPLDLQPSSPFLYFPGPRATWGCCAPHPPHGQAPRLAREKTAGVNWFTHQTRGAATEIDARGGSHVRFGCPLPSRSFAAHFDPPQSRLLVLLIGLGAHCGDHSHDRAREHQLGALPPGMRCSPLTSFGTLFETTVRAQAPIAFVSAQATLRHGLAPHRPQHGKRHNRRNDVQDRCNHKDRGPATGPSRQHVAQRN